jgi:hypothetical protein
LQGFSNGIATADRIFHVFWKLFSLVAPSFWKMLNRGTVFSTNFKPVLDRRIKVGLWQLQQADTVQYISRPLFSPKTSRNSFLFWLASNV